jgi:hypothetical protein
MTSPAKSRMLRDGTVEQDTASGKSVRWLQWADPVLLHLEQAPV